MNKGISKWPSKVLNLLVVLSMVIALCAVLASPVAAQAACDPVERFPGCNLEVFVNTYIKDAVTGDFTAVSEVAEDTCFYVNAVVVNTGNVTADGINATITFSDTPTTGIELAPGEVPTKDWVTDVNWQALDPTIPGRVAEFWWKVCCIDDNGLNTITVTANAAAGGCSEVTGTATIIQTPPPGEECLYIEIIEAPGWAAPGYTMTFPNALVTPCTNFGIKALVRNDCDGKLTNVNATIDISSIDGGSASIVGGDPDTWQLGDLYPGESRVVAWTLHCDGQGDVKIEVTSNYAVDQGPHNSYTVEQFGAGDLVVEITSPEDGYEVCAGCAPDNVFPIEVTVTNNTGETVSTITVQLAGNDTSAFTRTPSFGSIASLAHGSHATVTFSGTCTAYGDVLVTANAGGQGAVTYYDADPDSIVIHQKQVMASIVDYDAAVNICQPFEIVGQYRNCSGGILSNVEMSITWRGNATLILDPADPDRPYFEKYSGTTLIASGYFDPLNTVVEDLGGGWYRNTQTGIICQCCRDLVYWNFNCTGNESVESYTTIEWTGGDPPVTYIDDSETITIAQQWKAHLIVGNVPFLQDDNGLMWNRNAFAPGQNFHVVIPVANVGEDAADNVQVTFKILGDPARWNFVSISGDATIKSWTESTATGVATIPSIPGDSVKKIIVQLKCDGEGTIQFNVMSVVGTHHGPQTPIEASNIEKPPCPLDLYQIPFDVTIVNPFECTTYNPGDVFGVKAVIENGSEFDLENVIATIHWRPGDPVALAVAPLGEPAQTGNKTLGNVTADSVHEITWVLECKGPGEVVLWVTSQATIPFYITAVSDTVNVHQRDCIDVSIDILSPDSSPNYEDDWEYTAIATGEEFAVTALVRVNGTVDQQAEDVQACIYLDLNKFELVNGSACVQLYDMYTGDQATVTWTLRALATESQECGVSDAGIEVGVYTTSRACNPNNDYAFVTVTIYPAAHLEAQIVSITPVSPFAVCEEFEVTYRVYNYGEADAFEVEAVLSVNPDGSVRIAEGEGGYTRYLGTIPGWSYYGGGYSYVEDTFTLHCKQVCESTITITPKGNDECGWHTVFVQDADHWQAEYEWYNMPNREIDPEFIEPVSQTVKQVEFVPAEPDTSITTYDIELVQGWNLISLPLIPDDSDIADAFATIWPNFSRAAMYDGGFKTYIKGGPAPDFTTVSPEFGYWVLMNASDTLTVTGQFQNDPPSLPASYEVGVGWNLIGFHSVAGQTAGDYLSALTANGVPTWAKMWGYANGQWSPVGVNGTMNPGQGYWLAVTAAGTIYP
jgi:hypothetical protein